MEFCENIQCVNGYLECEDCNGTSVDEGGSKCENEDCFDGLIECECNPDNIRNK